MSIKHNRIKVSDLETNQPNKILITNENGELEFSDFSNAATEFRKENFEFTGSKIFVLSQPAVNVLSVVVDGITLNGTSGAPLQYRMNSSTELEILDEMILEEDIWVSITYNYTGSINSSSGVQSVTGDGVDNTDPQNPVITGGAIIENQIVEGVTDKGVSQNAVFNALSLKADDSNVLHSTTNETFTGTKSASNSGSNIFNGMIFNQVYGSGTPLRSTNSDSGSAIELINNGTSQAAFIANYTSGIGINVFNNGSGNGLYVNNNGSGNGVQINITGATNPNKKSLLITDNTSSNNGYLVSLEYGSEAAASMPFRVTRAGTTTYSITNTGVVTASSFKTPAGLPNQSLQADGSLFDLNSKIDKEVGKSLLADTEISRLSALSNYTHPANHPASIITQDPTNRFVTDAEKAIWNTKQASLGFIPENSANKNAASGYAGLGTDGKLLSSQLPSITVNDTFVIASQAAMLALSTQTGDIAVRTDLNKSFILKGTNPTLLSDWQELLTPTSAVTTVFGRNGAIVQQNGDYTADQISETTTRKFQTANQQIFNDATSSIQTQLNAKQANITAGLPTQYFRGDKTWQTLDKTVAGLANVDNTADAAKNVLSATKLTTARTINGTAFDGTANITIPINDTSKLPVTGGLMQGNIVFPDTDRSEGIFGTYDSAKTQSIWSMGTAYRNAADGSNFGTLYGLAYKHTNNSTGGNMAGGHQMVWCNNGIQKSSIGDGIWTSGSFIGSGAGLTGTAAALSIGGNAETSNSSRRLSFIDGPRTLSDRLPNSFARTVNFDFVNAGIVGGSGNYGGVMTFAPWDGLSTSTGDSSYQLAFRNESGVNGSGLPGLRLRKGIDTTWGGWYDMIHSGNYKSYSPTLTGIGASGTWDINVTGSVAGSSKFVDLLANRTDVAAYPILWGTNQATNPITGNASTYAFSCDAVKIQSSTGTIIANSFSGNNFISKPNSTAKTLYFGGTPSPSASQASVAVTNGNLHLDPSNGSAIYLGYLSGTGTNFGNGANGVAASISASGVFSGTGVTSSSTISASQYFNTAAAPGNGYGFWGVHPGTYGILMSDATNSSYGGRISGETSSDYNMYFSMAQGTNRGFVFRNGTTAIASINADGLRTSSDIIAFSSSDERLKDNVKKIEDPLEKLKAINGYTFDWNNKQSSYVGNDIGVIAQEIEKVMPQIVTTRENGFKAVKYEKIVPLLIEVCKEQQTQIEELKELVNKLIKSQLNSI